MSKTLLTALFSLPLTAIILSFSNIDSGEKIIPVNDNFQKEVVLAEEKKWNLDRSHSNVKFTVTHMVVSEVDGSFGRFNGSMETNGDDLSTAKVKFTVEVASINTHNENRDNHLRNDDFFNAEKYPEMKFESTSMKKTGDNKYQLTGNLTIRDVTKPVTFDVTHLGNTVDRGRTKAGFKAKATIDRFDYNLKWNRATEAGGLVVAKDVEININAAFVTAPAAAGN